MKKFLVLLTVILVPAFAFAQEKTLNPLYTLPKIIPDNNVQGSMAQKSDSVKPIIVTESGIYRVASQRSIFPLWTEGKGKQLLRVEQQVGQGKTVEAFYFVTSKGILY